MADPNDDVPGDEEEDEEEGLDDEEDEGDEDLDDFDEDDEDDEDEDDDQDDDEEDDDLQASRTPGEAWYVVEKAVYVLEKGLLLLGSKATSADFSVELRDMVEIVRPNGSRTRSRVVDIYPSAARAGGDLLVDGMRPSDVPPGSKLKVMHGGRRRPR
ncbi:MAG: hypothetical protein KIS92_15435 [Planctomycetota bacterium]|nr:hypothetical protein [Planctomycetota bacterium]